MIGLLTTFIPERRIEKNLLRVEDEQVVELVRHHRIVYFPTDCLVILAAVLFFVSLIPRNTPWILMLVAVAIIGYAYYKQAELWRDVFVITNMRVFRARGVFDQKLSTMPMGKIVDLTVAKPLVGQILGYGHFIFESAAQDQGLRDIRYVPDPEVLDLRIQQLIHHAGLRPKAPPPAPVRSSRRRRAQSSDDEAPTIEI